MSKTFFTAALFVVAGLAFANAPRSGPSRAPVQVSQTGDFDDLNQDIDGGSSDPGGSRGSGGSGTGSGSDLGTGSSMGRDAGYDPRGKSRGSTADDTLDTPPLTPERDALPGTIPPSRTSIPGAGK